jgi:hypothetical protein
MAGGGFPSIYCQVRVSWLVHLLYGSRLSFHLLPSKGQLVAGFLTSYMAAGFPSISCHVEGSWQQAFSPASWQQAFLSSIAR